jgi:hypothetical protein
MSFPFRHFLYPKNDLNVHDITSTKLKFVLSTNSSTRTILKLVKISVKKDYKTKK